jgi:hypothetical protein
MSSKVTGFSRHNPLKENQKSRRNPAAVLELLAGWRFAS